jgi:hypothetical protein
VQKSRFLILAVVVAAVTAVAAGSALALTSTKIPVTGTYKGLASEQGTGNAVTISATGTGKLTLLGAGKIASKGTADATQQPCVPFGGTGTISGPGGVITWKSPTGSQACGDEGGHTFTVKGVLTVVKATGKLAKAKGSIRYSGIYSHDDGSFSVKLTGTLTK